MMSILKNIVFPVFVAAFVALNAFMVVASIVSPSVKIDIEPAEIQHDVGSAFVVVLKFTNRFPFEYPSDASGSNRSMTSLLEDGHTLGPSHALHEDIRKEGKGAFSDWQGSLLFSSSDGSDPRVNGRHYEVSAHAQLMPGIAAAILALDFAFLLVFRRKVASVAEDYGYKICLSFGIVAVIGSALLATGIFGPIHVEFGGGTDAQLVVGVLRHAAIGCLITLFQWAVGAGVALLILRDRNAPIADVLLIGFPISLVLIGTLASIILMAPFGGVIAIIVSILCLAPLTQWRIRRGDFVNMTQAIAGILPLALIFGVWTGLLAHGPTETVPGRPSGDLIYYASSVWALQTHPFPFFYLANEGEVFLPFNMLFSAIGAALLSAINLDPFLFIAASGASVYALSLGIALFAYVSGRPPKHVDSYSFSVLCLAIVVAGRYPYWVVESIPIVFTLPLAIAIWYRVAAQTNLTGIFLNVTATGVGLALSKVTSAATLVPLALCALVPGFARMSKVTKIGVLVVVALASAVSLFMIAKYGPLVLAAGVIGPETYTWMRDGASFGVVLPYALRDTGTILLVFLAFRLTSWPIASALAIGLVIALAFSFFMRINLACAIIILGLIAFESVEQTRGTKYLELAAFALCLPAMLMTDFGGYAGGIIWIVCVGGIGWGIVVQTENTPSHVAVLGWAGPRSFSRALLIVSLVGVLWLIAIARGEVTMSPDAGHASLEISPEARDVWRVVRERTPTNTLIFTDQTGPDAGILTGWNTFATSGQRQVFIAGWFQSPELRNSPNKRAEKLKVNDEVLTGRLSPTELSYRRAYSSYFAAVRRDRVMPFDWKQIYLNSRYALYEYRP